MASAPAAAASKAASQGLAATCDRTACMTDLPVFRVIAAAPGGKASGKALCTSTASSAD
ncbi:hypothetical protein SAMN05216350_10247 [Polaromonas sp. YR568]|uniref:hypothetical protein n=1 Tax=Polaromonas sp. YR568 TaxID=1855301 RepID=UPI0008EB6C6D|nr:hypothetical protein [Polaromonas sp. YR568]SFU47308.1 hypothetical protein SAMN05216350_10247 [Polaromonas sp. YR568]